MKSLLSLGLALLLSPLFAQEVEIPSNIKLESKEDFQKTEALVLQSIEWYQNTPMGESKAKRKEVIKFLMMWMTGSPTVTLEIHSELISADCSECMIAFMLGWTQYSLQNSYSKDKVKGAMAGIAFAIEFYQKNQSELGKSKDMKKFIKLQKKGELEEFVQSTFN